MGKITFDQLKPNYNVVIVGAGAAGLMAAITLSRDFRVLVIECRSLPRQKACSGIIVTQGFEIFEKLKPPPYVYREPKNINITYLDWDNNKDVATKKNFLNTDRKTFDGWLFEHASEFENIDICDKTRLLDFYSAEDNKIVTILRSERDEVKSLATRYVIGADGAMSTIRKRLYNKEIPYYIAIQETIKSKMLDRAYFIFDKEITDYYCWLIPKDGKVEIGAAMEPYNAKEKFERFKCKVEKEFGIAGRGFLESGIILRPRNINDIFLGEKNILLAGEAAGLITPSGAEGISNALRSGEFAAQVINDLPENALLNYAEKCRDLLKRFQKKFIKADIIKIPEHRLEYFSENNKNPLVKK
ncbi:MAG: FAD-dependent monooxygenase [Nanoarchaeota archaeon]